MTPTKKYLIIAAIILLLLTAKKVSAEKLIAKFEGLRLKSYQDTGGVWTIGYGSVRDPFTGVAVKEGQTISKATALEWLKKEIEQRQMAIRKLVKVPITSNQLAAITSLAYNIGLTGFQRSTLLKLLNAKAPIKDVADQFLVFNKVTIDGKKVFVQGLMNRRLLERDLFLS